MLADPAASMTQATSFSWRIRTAPAGTTPRSPRARPWSNALCGLDDLGRTRFRPRSLPVTPALPAPPRPTGLRSSDCMTSSFATRKQLTPTRSHWLLNRRPSSAPSSAGASCRSDHARPPAAEPQLCRVAVQVGQGGLGVPGHHEGPRRDGRSTAALPRTFAPSRSACFDAMMRLWQRCEPRSLSRRRFCGG